MSTSTIIGLLLFIPLVCAGIAYVYVRYMG